MGLNILHWIGAFLYFAAMGLLVVVSVSAPIWNTVGFVDGTLNGQSFTGGVWGFCYGGVCSSSTLGYNAQRLSQLAGTNSAGNAIRYIYSKTLVLAPISAGLAFVALLFCLSTHFVMGLLASIWGFLAFVSTLLLLGLSLGFFITLRNTLNRDVPNTNLSLASCTWLVVAAAGCLMVGMLLVCFTRSSRNKRERKTATYGEYPAMRSTVAETPVASEAHYSGAASNVPSEDPLLANRHNSNSYAPTHATTTYGNAGTLGTDPTYGGGAMNSTYEHNAAGGEPNVAQPAGGHWWQRQESTRV